MTTAAQAGATAPAAGPTGRIALLLAEIRTRGGRWTTIRVARLYRRMPCAQDIPPGRLRAVARGDLRDLHVWGYLALHDEPSNRYYTLSSRKDRTR